MPFWEIIAVYSENNTKQPTQNKKLLIVEAGVVYNYHWALKGKSVKAEELTL
jgi:hypothetical protein